MEKAGFYVKVTDEKGQVFHERNFFAMHIFSSNIAEVTHFQQK